MRFNYQRSFKPPVSEDKFPNYRFKQLSLNKCMFSCLAKIHYEFLCYLSAIKCIIVCVDIHRCQFWSTVSNRRWLGEIQQQLPAQTTSEGARVAWSQPATTPLQFAIILFLYPEIFIMNIFFTIKQNLNWISSLYFYGVSLSRKVIILSNWILEKTGF